MRAKQAKDSLASAQTDQNTEDCKVLQLILVAVPNDPTDQIPDAGEQMKGGIFYRVPGQYVAKVIEVAGAQQNPVQGSARPEGSSKTITAAAEPDREHIRLRLPIAQLGKTASLPEKVAGRNMKYVVTLSADTGSITNFVLNTKAALDKDTVTSAKDAINAALDTKTNAIKAQTERLTAEKALIDAKKALDKAKEPSSTSTTSSEDTDSKTPKP